ncbi:MAG: VTT domain-containing protein [Dongiaceae bacterium]
MGRGSSRRLAAGLGLVLLLLGLGLAGWWLTPPVALGDSVERTVALIRGWGAWGVAGAIALMVAHSFLPFPAEILACANGMIWGPAGGAAVTWAGAMLGAAAAFGLVRWLGRPLLRRLLPETQLGRLDAWSAARGGGALLIARLVPLIAFNLLNYAAALTGISWWTFLWATGLGILPLTILLAVLGDRMLTLPGWAWASLAGAALLALVLLHRRPARPRP